ncbi:O-antigen/teichoic acid export membrane protein [Mangrovibacterium marinum]|uniref:O-antigen/teichoic acid export membrane protein n=1 Tax=Mangrovibacterium marinum TaxID=1639118 RepID=A0A2T5C6B1_9BACT|nr:polysaccharide biosynthesis C-terminal domain-containing protein [Mangrovibacterium marinum]PTN10480.1 O-antigen/teichoic acid export membrane protein [Mangrovibacterium marinum]
MGIIIKQSIKGTIWSYLGVIIGFVTTAYLYPNFLSPDIVGLFGLLVAYSTLFGQFSLLGVHGVTSRLFPYFRDKKSGHHGFLLIPAGFMATGFALFLVAYYFFAPYLIESNIEKSQLFADYTYLIIPLSFFTMLYLFLDIYNKVLYDAVFGTFLQEFIQRVLVLLVTLLYAVQLISLSQLIMGYALALIAKGLIMLVFMTRKGELKIRIERNFIDKNLRREILDVALFSVLGGIGYMLVFNIDKIIVNQMVNLNDTGVYTIAFYFGTLVIIPSRPLLKISGTLIADAWRENAIPKIKDIYTRSCLNQFIIGGFLFLGIWANIDNILTILGPDYLQSKWVIFFIGLGYLFDMMTGTNSQIIGLSPYYRFNLASLAILVVVAIALMYSLIPLWGIVGAAIAIASSLFLNNFLRFIFLLWKYRFQPFNWRFIVITFFYLGIYISLLIIPQLPLIPDILLRGGIITILSGLFFAFLPISADINQLFRQVMERLRKISTGTPEN